MSAGNGQCPASEAAVPAGELETAVQAGLEPLRYDLPLRTAADPPRRARVTLFEAMQAQGMTIGMVVQSKAGHDYGRLGIIVALRPPFAQIIDGRYRPADRPKQKRLSHLRPVVQADPAELAAALACPEPGQRDSAVRRLIRQVTTPLLVPAGPATEPDQEPPRR